MYLKLLLKVQDTYYVSTICPLDVTSQVTLKNVVCLFLSVIAFFIGVGLAYFVFVSYYSDFIQFYFWFHSISSQTQERFLSLLNIYLTRLV